MKRNKSKKLATIGITALAALLVATPVMALPHDTVVIDNPGTANDRAFSLDFFFDSPLAQEIQDAMASGGNIFYDSLGTGFFDAFSGDAMSQADKDALEDISYLNYDGTTDVYADFDAENPKDDYADLKAAIDLKVAAYTTLANGDLTTQVLVDAAKAAAALVDLAGLNAADTTAAQALLDAATLKVTAAQAVIDEAVKVAAAETAVAAYEVAPITTLAEITTAEGLKVPAEAAVDKVAAGTVKDAFTARIATRTTAIAAKKVSLSALSVSSVSAITNTIVDVVLTTAVTSVDAASFTIKNAAGVALVVNSATLSTDGKTVTLSTAAQTTGSSYTLTNVTNNFAFVGGVADTAAPTAVVAAATKSTTVTVTFTDTNRLDVASATNVANYTIPGLTVSGATVVGKVVTLTTSAQTAGSVYTVSVNGVKDVSGNAITTALTSSFAGKGADTTAPTVSTVVAYNNTKVVVTFNEEMDPTTATTLANYTIAGLVPTAVAFVSTDADATLYAATKNMSVVLTVPTQTAGTVYTVSVLAVKDASLNAITTASTATFAGKGADVTAPTVSTATAYNNTIVVVTFNENLDATSANTVANYTIAGLTPTAAELITTTANATLYGGTANRSVLLTVPAQTAGTVYTVSVLGVKDASANAITTASTATFAGKGADVTLPTITSVTTVAGNKLQIVFSEAMDSTSVQTLTNYSISTLGYPVSVDTWTAATRTLVLNTATQSNGVVYTLTTTGVKDTSNNVIAASTTNTFAGIGTALDAPALSSVTALDSSRVKVIFNKPVTGVALGDFVLYKGSGSTTDTLFDNTGATVTPLSTTDYVIFLGTAVADKLVSDVYSLKITSSAPVDLGGTALSLTDATKNQKSFGGVDTAAVTPAIVSLTQTGARTLVATFNQEMTTSALAAVGNVTVTYDSVTINAAATTAPAVTATDKTKVTFTFASDIAADKVAKLNILAADFAKFEDITGEIAMVKNATTNYEVQFGTQTFAASTLALSSVTSVDEQTLELGFNQDINFNATNGTYPTKYQIDGDFTEANFAVITKVSDGTTITKDMKYIEQTASSKLRVHFTGGANFAEGTIYKLAITNNAQGDDLILKASDGTALDAAVAANVEKTFGYVSTINAAPYLVSATPMSDNVVQITFSEPISAVFTTSGAATTDLEFYNGATQIPAGYLTDGVNIGTGADINRIFNVTATTPAVFAAGTTYTVKVPSTVTLTDKVAVDTIKTNTVAAPTQANVTFGGAAATVGAPTAADLVFLNDGTEQVISAAGVAQNNRKTLEVFAGTTAPTDSTVAEYTFDLTGAALTAYTAANLTAATDTSEAADTVYYRFVDQASNKSAWTADGTIPSGVLADADIAITEVAAGGVDNDTIVIASTATTRALTAGTVIRLISADTATNIIEYTLTSANVTTLIGGPLNLTVNNFTAVSGTLAGFDTDLTQAAAQVKVYIGNSTGNFGAPLSEAGL